MSPVQLRRSAAAIATFTALGMTLAACSSSAPAPTGSESESASPTQAPAARPLNIKFVSTYNGLPFYTATLCGMEAAADELGGEINVTMEGPSEGMNVSLQSPVLQAVIESRPDGIVLVPADPQALNPIIQQGVDAGIAIATTDVKLSEEIDLASFTTDNKAGGRLAGEEMVRLLKEANATGPILIIDIKTGLPVTNERAAGFEEVVTAAGYKVLPVQYNQNDPTQATTIVQATLQANPDLAGLFTTAEAAANGAVAGLQATSAADNVKVIGYDSGPVLVRALKDGTIDATIGQGSFDQGHGALTTVVKHLRDEPLDQPYSNVVENRLITLANVDDPEIAQRFLYPEKCDG